MDAPCFHVRLTYAAPEKVFGFEGFSLWRPPSLPVRITE